MQPLRRLSQAHGSAAFYVARSSFSSSAAGDNVWTKKWIEATGKISGEGDTFQESAELLRSVVPPRLLARIMK